MPENSKALAQRVVAAMLREDRATSVLGMKVLNADAGTSTVEMTVREDMLNGHKTCHGGLLFSLADSTFAFACNSRNHPTVAAGAQIDFLKPARQGDILQATAVELSAGRRLGLYDITLRNQRGEVVALFRGKSYALDGTLVEPLEDEAVKEGSRDEPPSDS